MKKELSKKNEYWIPKERYLELQHFCKQYDGWVKALNCIDSMAKKGAYERVDGTFESDPTASAVEAREYYIQRMDMIHTAALRTARPEISDCIIKCVTKGISYDQMLAKEFIGIGRNVFYRLCRQFYWELSKIRK